MRLLAAAALLALVALAPPASAGEAPKLPLPKGAKPTPDGSWSSPLGFRKTLDWYKKTLDKQGLVVEFLPPERFRDVTYARILSKDPAAAFTAIHVVLADGRTTIYILPPKNRTD
jgi:hypothetical protein